MTTTMPHANGNKTFFGQFVFPETGTLERGNLTVENGHITHFAAADHALDDATVLEGYVTPGLIDAHVHICLDGSADPVSNLMRWSVIERTLHAQRHLKQQLAKGVTTVRDLGGPDNLAITLANAVETGLLVSPRIITSGHNITMTGGHGYAFGHEADGVEGVRAAARDELKRGAHLLKFMATGGVVTKGVKAGAEAFTEAEMRAGIEEAHKAGKHTAAHAQGIAGISNALRAGIDTIEHGAFDHWSDEALDLLQRRFLVPTLAAPDAIIEGASHIPAWIVEKTAPILEMHQRNTHEAWQAGVPIVAGSDAGTPLNHHGRLIDELRLLHALGLSLLEVLQATTSTAAKAIRLEGQVGTLQTGAHADLAVWQQNPLEQFAYDHLQTVYVAGEMVSDAVLEA